jgi:hypothetical protein
MIGHYAWMRISKLSRCTSFATQYARGSCAELVSIRIGIVFGCSGPGEGCALISRRKAAPTRDRGVGAALPGRRTGRKGPQSGPRLLG